MAGDVRYDASSHTRFKYVSVHGTGTAGGLEIYRYRCPSLAGPMTALAGVIFAPSALQWQCDG